ncbi:MAG TPA: shikimate kinase [Candidatus Binatia bacterium]|nr:shikimate kinase [Candidatus Binatia bacterium]
MLTGFMATGKTAVGRRLAKRLGFDFLDTDQLIEERERQPVSAIFAARGEAEFRRIERELVASLAPARPTVIATGGGTFVDESNRTMLRRLGPVVCLITSLETTLERVGRNDKRPLATGAGAAERLATLLESRRPFYRMADVLVETDGLTVEQAVARVATAIAPRLRGEPAAHAAGVTAIDDSHAGGKAQEKR